MIARRWKSFARAERGNIAITAALAAPVLMMLGGGALDVHRAEQQRSRMQDALDAAVLAGIGADEDGDEDHAQEVFAANKAAGVPAGDFDLQTGELEGEVSTTVSTSFLKIIGVDAIPIAAFARAKIGNVTPPCVLVTERTNPGLTVASGSELNAAGCAVHAHSSNDAAVAVSNGGKLFSKRLCVKGGATGRRIEPAAVTGCTPESDPLAELAEPVVGGPCPDKVVTSGEEELTPGCYGKITVSNGAEVVLKAGVYRLQDELFVAHGAKVQGAGVTLHLATAAARLTTENGSTLKLSAPQSGPMTGMVIFQTRTAANAHPNAINFESGVHGLLEGVVYAPHTQMTLKSNASHDADYTLLILKSLLVDSGAKIDINTDFNSGPPLPRPLRPIYLEA